MQIGLNYLYSISYYVPECIALLTMVGVLFLEVTYNNNNEKRTLSLTFTSLGLLLVILSLTYNLSLEPTAIFYNAVKIDKFGTLNKLIAAIATFYCVYLGYKSKDIYGYLKSEFYLLVLGVLIGGMLLISANNFLTVYLGIETLSILSYPLAALKRSDEKSSEAGLKYALYGGISAGIMLFGISLIFGLCGTIQFGEITEKLHILTNLQKAILIPSFLLFFVGLGYKISSVPFHMWTPDVYEGSPIPVTTFFSMVPKIAGMAALVRISEVFFIEKSVLQYSWVGVLTVVSALTMTVGNVTAIGQRSVKRMLAYSSIAQIGNIMLGALVIDQVGSQAVVFYFYSYVAMTAVAFGVTMVLSDQYGNDYFDRFNGLIYRNPILAIALIVALFSLAGLPPFIGFVAKFNIISGIVKNGFYTLAVVAVLNSVISLYYYMRLVRLMVLKKPDSNEELYSSTTLMKIMMVCFTAFIIFSGIFWERLYNLTSLGINITVNH